MEVLTKNSRSLLITTSFIAAATVVMNTFINVFFMRATDGNMAIVVFQNIIGISTMSVGYIIAAKLLLKMSMPSLLKLGIFSLFLYLLIIVVFQNYLRQILIPVAIFHGLGLGLYWFTINLFVVGVIQEQERGRYFGYQITVGNILAIVIPVISGIIIISQDELFGYYILFGIALFFYLLAIAMTLKLPKEKMTVKVQVWEVIKVKNNRYYNTGKMFRFVIALKETLNVQTFMLFGFLIIGNEGILGNIISITAVVATASCFWFSRKYRKESQQGYYLFTGLVMMGSYLILIAFPSMTTFIIVQSALAVFGGWSIIIYQSVFLQLATLAKGGFEAIDYITVFEFPAIMGRVCGLLFALLMIYLIESEMLVYRLLFIVIAIAWVLEYIIIEKQVKWFREEPKNPE